MPRGRLDLDKAYIFGRWLIQNGERPFCCIRSGCKSDSADGRAPLETAGITLRTRLE